MGVASARKRKAKRWRVIRARDSGDERQQQIAGEGEQGQRAQEVWDVQLFHEFDVRPAVGD